ncbi:MAG: hypothetical protein JWP36_1749 [Paucimonas sp.]|nr:hypothetical protein [Paucimonas sp.]
MRLSIHARPQAARTVLALILASLLPGCGGGSSSAPASGVATSNAGNVANGGTLAALTMSCPDGAGWQCSGETVLQTDNGISLTRSGVEAFGKSTNDLQPVIEQVGRAIGMMPATGGTAEVRVRKDANGAVSSPAVLLSNLDISWDAKTDRPIIIETFMTAPGRVELDANRALAFRPLPPVTDEAFWDMATKGQGGTKLNYANNSYFPRAEPGRCPADLVPCPTKESDGVNYKQGDWRTGGIEPDLTVGGRLHEDGDAAAGIGHDANGNVTYFGGSTAPGVPFPGSKGYRTLDNWSLRYANFATWSTQDTVNILEWGGLFEHNRGRRGVLAFGDVTDPATVPASGSASYTGVAYGWYSVNAKDDPIVFRAAATATVNFATRQVSVALANSVIFDASLAPVPTSVSTNITLGSGAQGNYATGTAANAAMAGGLSARFFGPVVTTGNSGAGPAELAGVFSMNNAGSGQFSLGGFIGSKR